MKFSKTVGIVLSALILTMGIVTFSYAQYTSSHGKGNPTPSQVTDNDRDTQKDTVEKPYVGTKITGEVSGQKVILNWQKVDNPKFSGYKVVISKNNPNPKYPENGYLYFITDQNTTSAIVDNTQAYNNGDFGEKLLPGEAYYFSITVLYSDKTIPGDTIQLTYPKAEVSNSQPVPQPQPQPTPLPSVSATPAPRVTAFQDGNKIIVKWDRIDSANLKGYKVVISKNHNDPIYDRDGYLAWITDRNETQWVIDNSSKYNGGDFGGYLVPGQAYYISVTAIYYDSWVKVRGNAVKLSYPSNGYYPATPVSLDPVRITVTTSGSNLILSWPKVTASNFVGYKVVISKNNPNPKYPDDGYLEWITDRNKTSVTVNSQTFYNGDINGNLVAGQQYYFSISVIYDPWQIIPGPAVRAAIPN